MQVFSSQGWTGVVWIIVMFLSALILTAPIHCRASVAERFFQIWRRNKLGRYIYIYIYIYISLFFGELLLQHGIIWTMHSWLIIITWVWLTCVFDEKQIMKEVTNIKTKQMLVVLLNRMIFSVRGTLVTSSSGMGTFSSKYVELGSGCWPSRSGSCELLSETQRYTHQTESFTRVTEHVMEKHASVTWAYRTPSITDHTPCTPCFVTICIVKSAI